MATRTAAPAAAILSPACAHARGRVPTTRWSRRGGRRRRRPRRARGGRRWSRSPLASARMSRSKAWGQLPAAAAPCQLDEAVISAIAHRTPPVAGNAIRFRPRRTRTSYGGNGLAHASRSGPLRPTRSQEETHAAHPSEAHRRRLRRCREGSHHREAHRRHGERRGRSDATRHMGHHRGGRQRPMGHRRQGHAHGRHPRRDARRLSSAAVVRSLDDACDNSHHPTLHQELSCPATASRSPPSSCSPSRPARRSS